MRIIDNSEKHVSAMNTAVNTADYRKAEEICELWEASIDRDIKKIEELGDFHGDTLYQRAVLNDLKGYQKIITDDYPKLINMRKQAKADHPETEATLLSNINGAFENMANGVNGASDAFEKKYNRR